jgi:hypothetical protein
MAKEVSWSLNKRELKVSHRHVGPIVGRMMDRIWGRFEDVPPVNMLVVNAGRSAAPGTGAGWYVENWLVKEKGWYKALNDADKQAAVRRVWREIRKYRHWEAIASCFDSEGLLIKALKTGGDAS